MRSRVIARTGPDLRVLPGPEWELRYRTIHGYRRAYRMAGRGPALLLIHGIGDDSSTWSPLMPVLARNHTVIAPDLLGHGGSDKPRADYSVAAYANGMRDLLGVLGIERVTLVGHSLGGGVAMQFAYQFAERTERVVLVGTGGVGRSVNPALRAVSLPLADHAFQLARLPGIRLPIGALIKVLGAMHPGIAQDGPDILRLVDALPDATARSAFIRTLRAVVDWRGQVVTMLDRCYLTSGMPTLLIWGDQDCVVPPHHAQVAHRAMPGSRLEIFEGAGHFPFHTDPVRFNEVLLDFLESTEPAGWSPEQWRELLRLGRPDVLAEEAAETRERSVT